MTDPRARRLLPMTFNQLLAVTSLVSRGRDLKVVRLMTPRPLVSLHAVLLMSVVIKSVDNRRVVLQKSAKSGHVTCSGAPTQQGGRRVAPQELMKYNSFWTFPKSPRNCFVYDYTAILGSRVVSVLDSGAEGPGFKSQLQRCRVTVLGKLFTPIVPLPPSSKIDGSPLKGCDGNCGPGGKWWQPTAGFMTHVTCRLTAKNRDQRRNPTLVI